MKLKEVTLFENKTHRILNEGYVNLNEQQRAHVLRYEKELWPLIEELQSLFEQTLSSQQIMQIFRSAEEVAMDSGANRTALGKAGDTAVKGVDALKKTPEVYRKIQAKIKELQTAVKDSGPVKNADATFNNLKKKISDANPDSEIVKGVQAVSDWAKANPGKATIAVGILTAVASFISGPAGGAAAGFILRSTKDLLQGKDLSTATGNALKTAAIGALVGVVADQVGEFFQGARAEVIDSETFTTVDYGASKTLSAPGFRWTETLRGVNVKVTPEDAEIIQNAMREIGAGGNQASEAFDTLSVMADAIKDPDYVKEIGAAARDNDSLYQFITAAKKGITALAQGTAAASGDRKESLEAEYQRYLAEGPFGNIASKAAGLMKKGASATGSAIKKGASKAADVAGDAADYAMDKTAPMRKELGNKVTQKKLQQAWKDLGEPKDIASIYDILTDAGMDADLIQAVSVKSDVKITKTNAKDSAPAVDLKKLAAEIKKSGAAEIVKKQLATAPKAATGNFDKDKFQKRADRARSMKQRPVR